MTGYGAASATEAGVRVQVEVRSGNGRFSEVRVKLPAGLSPFESDLRKRVAARVRRGRADVSISLDSDESPGVRVKVNRPLARQLLDEAARLKSEFGLSGTVGLPDLLRLNGLIDLEASEREAVDEGVLALVRRTLDGALAAHDAARLREGEQLCRDLRERLEETGRLAARIRERASAVPRGLQERLRERVGRLAQEVPLDPARLEQEVAYLADRSDITEELVRLDAHIAACAELLAADDPVGKRLEFLLQEVGRETNTIGSKSPDLEITRCTLAIKAEAEKMREQIQNVE